MALKVSVSKGIVPRPKPASRATVIEKARKINHPHADRALALTVPELIIDRRSLRYSPGFFNFRSGFRFRDGTLHLRLRQEMYIDSGLSLRAQEAWEEHERLHALDNMRIMGEMERAIRSSKDLKPLFVERRLYRHTDSDRIKHDLIHDTVEAIFKNLAGSAVRQRDTPAEYRRVRIKIFNTSEVPFFHEVARGETLSRLSLDYYGRSRLWPSIYRVNKQAIGANPDLISPGQRLRIPKNP